jgi:hypothetical protein
VILNNAAAINSPVHTPDTSYNVHRQNNRTKNGKLSENVGRLLLTLVHPDVDLSEVVAMSAGKKTAGIVSHVLQLTSILDLLLIMTQVARHGDNMILDIAKIHANLIARCNVPLLVAPLRKALDDIGLVT